MNTTTSNSSSFSYRRRPIGVNDFIVVRDRYLYYNSHASSERQLAAVDVDDSSSSQRSSRLSESSPPRSTTEISSSERFLMQGIAFPVAIPPPVHENDLTRGWMEVLEQLAELSEINTIRLYSVHCDAHNTSQYDIFFERAAELGIYIVAPLTSASGAGVLDRGKRPPECYPQKLYDYGVQCLDLYSKHPNILMGLVGNEVLNSLQSWTVAPCVYSYANDLQKYMAMAASRKDDNPRRRKVPLAYAAQHDSFSAGISPEEHMRLTVDYLTCAMNGNRRSDSLPPPLDIMGVNIESWCSSLQTFEHNEDGTTSSYKKLYDEFNEKNITIPLVFTEEGCSKNSFNRDNGMNPQMSRDWKQIPVVLNEMNEVVSGFCAYGKFKSIQTVLSQQKGVEVILWLTNLCMYIQKFAIPFAAYDGNPTFRMMQGSWNGRDGVLEPGPDFDAFAFELHQYHQHIPSTSYLSKHTNTTYKSNRGSSRLGCDSVLEEFRSKTQLPWNLHPIEKMPSWFKAHGVRPLVPNQQGDNIPGWRVIGYFIGLILLVVLTRTLYRRRREQNEYFGSSCSLQSLMCSAQEIQKIATSSISYDSMGEGSWEEELHFRT